LVAGVDDCSGVEQREDKLLVGVSRARGHEAVQEKLVGLKVWLLREEPEKQPVVAACSVLHRLKRAASKVR
jgi:hypothetical protein